MLQYFRYIPSLKLLLDLHMFTYFIMYLFRSAEEVKLTQCGIEMMLVNKTNRDFFPYKIYLLLIINA